MSGAQVNILTVHGQQHQYCANCPVRRGECLVCGTFWTRADSGSTVYGVIRVDQGFADGPTTGYPSLDHLPNVIVAR